MEIDNNAEYGSCYVVYKPAVILGKPQKSANDR